MSAVVSVDPWLQLLGLWHQAGEKCSASGNRLFSSASSNLTLGAAVKHAPQNGNRILPLYAHLLSDVSLMNRRAKIMFFYLKIVAQLLSLGRSQHDTNLHLLNHSSNL